MLTRLLLLAALLALPAQGFAADLLREIRAGNVRVVSMTGNGSSSGAALDGVLQNMTGQEIELDVQLADPLFFRNSSGSAQDMLATQVYGADGTYYLDGDRPFLTLPAGARMAVFLVAYCVDFDLDNPDSSNSFSLMALPAGLDGVGRRIAAYEAAHADADLTTAAQLALWMAQGETPERIAGKFDFTRDDLRIARDMLR